MDRLLSASPRPKWLEAALPIVVMLAALAGCSREPRAVNVLIVSIDTLRADHLGCYGYAPYAQPVSPRIDEFAKRGLLFEECSTARGQTAPSLGSLMTGLYPSRHGVLDNGVPFRGGVRSLAQQLMAVGYDAHAFVSFVPGSRNGRATLGIPPEQVVEVKRLHPDWAFSRCDEAAEQSFVRFVEQRKGGARPFFAWVHFYDVHQPYTPPPPFDAMFDGDYRGALKLPAELATQEQREAFFNRKVEPAMAERMLARAPLERDDARYLVALYDGGIRETDERFGRILDALERRGLRDETLVILTSDHGEELGQHNHFWFHGNSVHAPVLHIPLIFGGPGVRAGRCADLIQNVDVLPTVLEWVGAPAPGESDGLSFAKLLRPGGDSLPPPRTISWSEWRDWILGARTRERRLIFNPRGAHPKLPPYHKVEADTGYFVDCAELYDVVRDPLEVKDLWDEQKESVAELRARVTEEYERRGFGGGTRGAGEEPLDPAEAQRMAALGYVGSLPDSVVLNPESCRERH
jgi:arylsulfatase